MTYQAPRESSGAQLDPREILLADLIVKPDVNRHIAIAWARLAGAGRAAAPDRVTVLKPFNL